MEAQILSITQLNAYVRAILEEARGLYCLYLRGEISGFKRYGSGHCYFSLKDSAAQVSAVMFAGAAARLAFSPQEGLRVVARARVSLYEPRGQFQVIIDDLQPDGVGALYQQLEKLKALLKSEGLFDDERKKTIPLYPQKIAVVTSAQGAVIKDIQQVLARRWPLAEIFLYPTAVQGIGAGEQIAGAIYSAAADDFADVMIVGRGGGSVEDLWSFNDECVVRAVADCPIPIVSAVGHETDFTLCDFAADLRAPTPSAAAELCVPDMGDELMHLDGYKKQCLEMMNRCFARENECVSLLKQEILLHNPANKILQSQEKIRAIEQHITHLAGQYFAMQGQKIAALAARIDALSPLKTLARGYAIVSKDDTYLAGGKELCAGDEITVRMYDVQLGCVVKTRV
ncbi:MAG: exodeoxyribonuclease VII large subunit [Oscillospiraceae bacterium]|nr:exodeoxyribonuclease VII large subunit [Oscillospiraceae bacterium]